MRVLLDTHAFLWWLDGDRRLSQRAKGDGQHYEEALEHGNQTGIDWICGGALSRGDTKRKERHCLF
jgi:hypothetical protein